MSVDKLQEKIRKLKNPSVVDLSVSESQIPPHILEEEGSFSKAYCRFSSSTSNLKITLRKLTANIIFITPNGYATAEPIPTCATA